MMVEICGEFTTKHTLRHLHLFQPEIQKIVSHSKPRVSYETYCAAIFLIPSCGKTSAINESVLVAWLVLTDAATIITASTKFTPKITLHDITWVEALAYMQISNKKKTNL